MINEADMEKKLKNINKIIFSLTIVVIFLLFPIGVSNNYGSIVYETTPRAGLLMPSKVYA